MRATLWIAASGLLLASSSAFAVSIERPVNDEGVYLEESAAAAPGAADMTRAQTNQAAQTSAPDVSKAQPAQPSSQAQAGTPSNAVTFDPDHPGGEFPSGG